MSQATRRERGRAATRIVGAVLVLGAVAALVVWSMEMRSQSAGPIDAELARLGAAGFPTTLADAYGVPEPPAPADPEAARAAYREMQAGAADDPPDGENGVEDVWAAFNWLEETLGHFYRWNVTGPWDSSLEEDFPEGATPEQSAALAEILGRARPFFDRVDEGLAKPVFRLSLRRDFMGFVNLGLGCGGDLLQLLAARAAAAATPEERLAAMSSAARLARRIEPRAGFYLALGARCVAIREARRAAESGTIPAAELRRALDGDLAESFLPRLPAVARGMPVELATTWRDMTRLYPLRPGERFARSLEHAFHRSTCDHIEIHEIPSDDMAVLMRRWAEVAAIDASSPEKLRAAVDALAARSPDYESWGLDSPKARSERLLRMEAAAGLARVALAAKAHREATGAWPASIAELAPAFGGAVPTDARTGKPFVYATASSPTGPKVRIAGNAPDAAAAGDEKLREDLLLWEFAK